MTTYGLLMCVPMFALLAWAAVTDCAARRIPNWLSYSLILTGLLQSFTTGAVVGPGASALGMLAGFALTFVFFALGAMGGGDVKLLTGVGAWLGPVGVLLVFVVDAVVGLTQAVIQAAAQRRLPTKARSVRSLGFGSGGCRASNPGSTGVREDQTEEAKQDS